MLSGEEAGARIDRVLAAHSALSRTRLKALILDGAVDPKPTDDSEWGEQGVSIQGAFNRLIAWCDANTSCPFGNGTTRKAFDALMASLDKKPLPLADGRSLNGPMAWTGVILTLYNRSYWQYAVDGLAAAADGDGSQLASLADYYNDRLADGSYTLWIDNAAVARNVTVAGGSVTGIAPLERSARGVGTTPELRNAHAS